MKKFTSWLIVGGMLVGLMAASPVSAKGAVKGEVKIGLTCDLSGAQAMYGVPTKEGVEMAAEELNAKGGILGRKVVIVAEDHHASKTEAATVVQRYITRDKVSAIIGDAATGITKVIAGIANKAKIVDISAGATGSGVVEIGPYVFRNTLLDSVAAPVVSKYLASTLKWKKVALVTSTNNDYSVGLTALFKPALVKDGVEIVTEQSIEDGKTDFSAQVTQIKDAKVDGIVFTGYYTEGGLFMKEVQAQGMTLKMVGGDGLYGKTLMDGGQSAVVGSMVYVGFSPEQPSAVTAKFIKAFQKKFSNRQPDIFNAQGYDAVMILAKAMTDAKSIDPKVYRATLAKTKNFPGVSGVTTFLATREPLKSPLYLLEVKQDAKGALAFGLKAKLPVLTK